MIQILAFKFAEKLGIKHNFNKDFCKAGSHWLQWLIEHYPELSVRQAKGLSLALDQGLNRKEVNKMFELLLQILTEHNLLDKPDRIFNIDEIRIQLNSKPKQVVATKSAKFTQLHLVKKKKRC